MARNDKHLALELRKQRKSYNFISKELGIPKGTLSDWFGALKWSSAIKSDLTDRANFLAQKRMRLIARANKKRWAKWREMHRLEAIREFPNLIKSPLFIAGLMLYWAEGDTHGKGGNVRLSNIDPRMIRVFVNFAKKICNVQKEKIRIGLILYPDLNDPVCKNYWSRQTGIPLDQFHKTQVILGNHPTKRLQNGICMVRIGGTGLKEKIQIWIDLYAKELMRV